MAKARPAAGRRAGDHVVVADPAQASRLHGKGNVGQMDGTALRLGAVEAAWLASEGRLEVRDDGGEGAPMPAADLLRLGGGRSEVEFLAYADLRGRGLAVRPWRGGWAVWPRGGMPSPPGPAPPAYLLAVRAEREAVAPSELLGWGESATVLGLVDEDGAVTYYQAGVEAPAGSVPLSDLPRLSGIALADRVLVAAPEAAEWRRREHLGSPTGAGLVLSFTEAEALRRRGRLGVEAGLAQRAAAVQPHFARTLPVYEALRAAGVVAKSGFKFGTHLRGYRGDPDAGHAEWLVHCAAAGEALHWADLARAIRVAHGVRKAFLVAVVGEPVRFARLAWFKP